MMPRPYEGNEPFIFVAFDQKDRNWAYRLMDALAEKSYRLWYDDILAQSKSVEAIMNRLRAAEAVVFLVTPHSLASPFCMRLFNLSTRLGKFIVPVSLALANWEDDSLHHMFGEFDFQLSAMQMVVWREGGVPRELIDLLARDSQLACCREDGLIGMCDCSAEPPNGLSKLCAMEDLDMCHSVEESCERPIPHSQPAKESQENGILCSHCGSLVMEGLRFCPVCGMQLSSDQAPARSIDAGAFAPSRTNAMPDAPCQAAAETRPRSRAWKEPSGSEEISAMRESIAARRNVTTSRSTHTAAGPLPQQAAATKRPGGGFFSKLREAFPRRRSNDMTPTTTATQPEQTSSQPIATPAPAVSDVSFEAVAPSQLMRGRYATVDLVMFEDGFERVVDQVIAEHDEPIKTTSSGWLQAAHKARVRVDLSSPELGALGSQQGIWNGRYLRFGFSFKVPRGFLDDQALLTAVVYFDDLPATRLSLVVSCTDPSSQASKNQTVVPARSDIKEAFVSYASEDRARVATIIQGMRTARPDLGIFFDVESLRSGEDWQSTLRTRIEKSDVLFLCWSRHASASPWVDYEWHYALDTKGIEFIEPVAIEPPFKCPPPPELSSKHFNDMLLYIIDAHE